MLKFIPFLLLLWWGLGVAASPHYIGILPPEIKPEREYGYLKGSLYNFLLDRLNKGPDLVFIHNEQIQNSGLIARLRSNFIFPSPSKAQIELYLLDPKEKRTLWQTIRETTPEHFWMALERELENLQIYLRGSLKGSTSKPHSETVMKDEKVSLVSRLNPLKAISKLLPKKDDPLRVKVQVPPPPPPPGVEKAPQPLLFDRKITVPSKGNEPLTDIPSPIKPTYTSSPWQWY
ncbi:MAG: hypothetical protein RMI93_07825 [Caldimicrobium sp.]|nr:hypothetical protein [Caldimicrobium sp.]MDW8183493.1 hypothetical protein [Caldimicrobium sp.]